MDSEDKAGAIYICGVFLVMGILAITNSVENIYSSAKELEAFQQQAVDFGYGEWTEKTDGEKQFAWVVKKGRE